MRADVIAGWRRWEWAAGGVMDGRLAWCGDCKMLLRSSFLLCGC